jgi:hypothetical protein
MKTIFVVFALFCLGSTLSAQVVRTQKVKVSKVTVQSKSADHNEPSVTGKKGLVKKTMVVDRKKLVVQKRK